MTRTKKYFFLSCFLISLLMFAYTPNANATTSTKRIAGYDKYKTAVAVSQSGWPDGANSAILAFGENFPDALSAGPLANKYNAPILLTGSNQLNSDTAVELKRLKTKKVYIIGGYAVVSRAIENQLSVMQINTVRLAGHDRYETSLVIAQEIGVSKGVFVTTGLDFPDALSIAPLASTKGMPILLVPSHDLTPQQKVFLSKNNIPNSYIITGKDELSDNIIRQFPDCEVIGGKDRYERNINLIKRFSDSVDFSAMYFATGELFPDALTASALAQKGHNAIILLKKDTIPEPALSFLRSKIIGELNILGGSSVISSWTETSLSKTPAKISSVANVNDSVQERQQYAPPKTVTVTNTNGLKEEVTVTWSLASVQTLKAGIYKFEGTIKAYSRPVYLNLTVYPVVAKVDNISAEIILGDSYSFPSTVAATMSDSSVKMLPVTWSSNIVPLNKVGSYTFQGKLEDLTQTVTITLKISQDAKITFDDPALRLLVGNKIGKDLDETIYKRDVINISSLNAKDSNIIDLSGLEHFANLRTLYLGHNPLTKVTALSKLTNLKTLDLTNTGLKNLTSIKALTSLTYLDISDNNITDFSPLRDFIRLTTLYLRDNKPLVPNSSYTPDYSSVRVYYTNLTKKDFSL